MGGALLNKRYIKRKVAEEEVAVDREEGEIVDTDTTADVSNSSISCPEDIALVPRKRRKQASPKAAITISTHKDAAKHRVSFNSVAPSVVLIDGLGSQIIQRFRDSIWYTKNDYRTFWKDRVETVRVWHSLYGGIEDDEYVARMLDDTFTIRGLENYVCDPAEAAENLDPKKNRYVQAVLRAQRIGRVDAHAIHEEVKEITEASLRKAQALAILDERAVMSVTPRFAIEPNGKPRACPVPISPNSVLGIDLTQQPSSRSMKSFNKKLLEHMDEGQRRKIIIEHRRNSMQLYQAEERRKSEIQQSHPRRLSIMGRGAPPLLRRQSLSGVPSASSSVPPPHGSGQYDMGYGKMMRGHRDSLAMDRRMSTGTRQPITLKQHPRSGAPSVASASGYPRDSMSLGPRPSRKQQSMRSVPQAFSSHAAARRTSLVGVGCYSQHQQQLQQQYLQQPSMEQVRMFSLSQQQQQQQRRDSVYGTIFTTPQSMSSVQMQRILHRDPTTYTEMIGGFPGMRRDSLAGHYEHS